MNNTVLCLLRTNVHEKLQCELLQVSLISKTLCKYLIVPIKF